MMLEETLKQIVPLDRSEEGAALTRLQRLTKPKDSLGRLEELALRVAVIQRTVPPRLGRKVLMVFAADHGISEEGVSAYPRDVTAQMTHNFLAGGAAINVLARHHDVETVFADVGVNCEFGAIAGLRDYKVRKGTANFARGPAMTRAEARRAIEVGIELAREASTKKVFLLGAGDMGIGNTASAAAILCALGRVAPVDSVGRGTGIDDAALARKIAAVEKGLQVNRPDPTDPLDVLAKVGGLEIGAITGLILGASSLCVPMVLDGFVSGAAALLAQLFSPHVRDLLFASHLSAEKAHGTMLDVLGLTPVFDLRMRLGEGTGACLLMGLIESAVKLMREMATFESAGVKEKLA
jgi:nicotinate-nucleotide--dimethylbenzimidazole phosphoribosyltransferase